jgi:hypothetical protein
MEKSLEESLLYKNFIMAQFAYFKFLESKRLPEFVEFAKNKEQNPNYFGFGESIPICEHTKQNEKSHNTKTIKKKLALLFHPDKNPDRVVEANILFSFIHNLTDEEILESIYQSKDPWKTANLKINNELKEMENFCNNVQNSLWFNIENKSYFYKTIEEVISIYKKEIHQIIYSYRFFSDYEWDYDWYIDEVADINNIMQTNTLQSREYLDQLKLLYKRAKENDKKLTDFNSTLQYRRTVEQISGASYY